MTAQTDGPTPPAPTLTTRERAGLKARAHALEPLVRVGHAGLTDASVAEIGRALDSHELIKVKLGEGDRDARAEVTNAIQARTGAALVQQVGRVLVLWRPKPDDEA
ncbi:MAG TPA: ribosome assembly RNA-binding protein YhbY [Luteitalea sp.]|nr:ribosome assembly RNA-binding protein YhbY [Luteitalea sp.]